MRSQILCTYLITIIFASTSGHGSSLGFLALLKRKVGQAVSSTQFYLYGRKHCTKIGYVKHVKKYSTPVQSTADIRPGEKGSDGYELAGKVVVISGANSGIGKELATYAAAKGAKIYMLCRSKDRAEAARDDIVKLTSSEEIEILLANMGELSQIKRVVSDLQSKEQKVDVLVCNAGLMSNDRVESSEGKEMTFASHLLGGSYLLSRLLLPRLKDAGAGQVIFVSSGGMYNSKFPDWETATSAGAGTERYDGQFAYCYAKRGQVLLAERLTRDIPEVMWLSAHPGWVDTGAMDSAFGDATKYWEPMRSPWEGAEGIAWLMAADKSELRSGEFYLDRKPDRKHLSGLFFREGSFTKSTDEEVDEMIERMKQACELPVGD